MSSSLLNILLIGHSLIGPVMPAMVQDMVGQRHEGSQVSYQVINGASLAANWEHSAKAEGVDTQKLLPTGDVDVVVMTEALPLLNHKTWSGSDEHALKFYDLAIRSNPAARVYLFETWHSLNSGTGVPVNHDANDETPWRVRIDHDRVMWESITDFVNDQRATGQPEMLIVPGGQAMGLLHDEIGKGTVPGLERVNDVFDDDIHPNDIGNYFVALVQYATIYGESPVGLSAKLHRPWGEILVDMDPKLAKRFQEIAWEAVQSYPRAGVVGLERRSEWSSPTAIAAQMAHAGQKAPDAGLRSQPE